MLRFSVLFYAAEMLKGNAYTKGWYFMRTVSRRLRFTITFLFLLFAAAGISTAYVQVEAQAAGATGFVNRGTTTYYYKNGKKVTGFVTVNGKTYYFDKNGVQKQGWVKVNGKTYYSKWSSVKKVRAQ